MGRENDASEMLLSELAMQMDMKAAEEATVIQGPGEKEQHRRRKSTPVAEEAPQAWEARSGQGQGCKGAQ